MFVDKVRLAPDTSEPKADRSTMEQITGWFSPATPPTPPAAAACPYDPTDPKKNPLNPQGLKP